MKKLLLLSIVLLASVSGLKAANDQSNTPTDLTLTTGQNTATVYLNFDITAGNGDFIIDYYDADGVHQSIFSSQCPTTLTVMTNEPIYITGTYKGMTDGATSYIYDLSFDGSYVYTGNIDEEFYGNEFTVDCVLLIQSSGNLTIQIYPYPH